MKINNVLLYNFFLIPIFYWPLVQLHIFFIEINGSLSTVVGDEKLTSREDLIGLLFLYVQSDENTLPKVNKVSKTEA